MISTGTVALQSQLVERDIPAFLKATGLEASVALAKGRTRYLCTRNAAELEGDTSQNAMFEDEQALYDRPLSPVDADLAKRLAKAYAARTWNGDLDDAPEQVSVPLRMRITTPASGCAGRRCSYAAQCPVLKARTDVREAQIVVTNHALLLSSLSLGDAENGQPLIAPPADMLLVLDEGHHIAGVAIDQGAANLPLDDMARRTGRMQILIAAAYRAVDKDKLGNLLPNEAIEVAARVSRLLKAFHADVERVWKPEPGERDPLWRAANGKLPPQWGPGHRRTRRRNPRAVQLGACRTQRDCEGKTRRFRARRSAAQPSAWRWKWPSSNTICGVAGAAKTRKASHRWRAGSRSRAMAI